MPELVPFKEKFGPEMGCFVEMPVELGIARLMEMGIVEAPTGIPAEEQYEAWAKLALEAIEGYDGLYIHIKGPDVPAHDGDHEAKIDSIEEIDSIFFAGLLDELDLGRTIVAVTADHSTSCARKAHTDGPVPLLVSGGGVSLRRGRFLRRDRLSERGYGAPEGPGDHAEPRRPRPGVVKALAPGRRGRYYRRSRKPAGARGGWQLRDANTHWPRSSDRSRTRSWKSSGPRAT